MSTPEQPFSTNLLASQPRSERFISRLIRYGRLLENRLNILRQLVSIRQHHAELPPLGSLNARLNPGILVSRIPFDTFRYASPAGSSVTPLPLNNCGGWGNMPLETAVSDWPGSPWPAAASSWALRVERAPRAPYARAAFQRASAALRSPPAQIRNGNKQSPASGQMITPMRSPNQNRPIELSHGIARYSCCNTPTTGISFGRALVSKHGEAADTIPERPAHKHVRREMC